MGILDWLGLLMPLNILKNAVIGSGGIINRVEFFKLLSMGNINNSRIKQTKKDSSSQTPLCFRKKLIPRKLGVL